MDILNQMIARAKANPQRIVLPEGNEPQHFVEGQDCAAYFDWRPGEDQRHGRRKGL